MAVRKGSFTVKCKAKDNLSGAEDVSDDTGQLEVPTKAGDVAIIKSGTSVKLSLNYQSIGVDVGVEIPWKVTSKTLKRDLEEGFKFADEVVDQKVGERVREAKELLNKLSGR